MTNENSHSQILGFPSQLADTVKGCDDIEILSFQVKLWATKLITGIQNGDIKPTEKVIQNIKNGNELLAEWGKPQLPLDFLD